MSDPAGWQFVEDPASYRDADARIARVPAGVRSKLGLLSVLARELQFPDYFGFNWDALNDCLCDLHWLPNAPRRIVIAHETLPLRSPAHRRCYLEILRNAIASWQSGAAHELAVVFPVVAQSTIWNLLRDTGDPD